MPGDIWVQPTTITIDGVTYNTEKYIEDHIFDAVEILMETYDPDTKNTSRSIKEAYRNPVAPPSADDVWRCTSCGMSLGLKNGMSGTGLCGPCCTGESETLYEKGETW